VDLICNLSGSGHLCGERDIEVLNVLDGDAVIDYSTSNLYSYASTGYFLIDISSGEEFGQHEIRLHAKFKDYSSLGYFP
jgi:hypothetical protein